MQVLLSVMEEGDPLTYIDKLGIGSDALIVNQCSREGSSSHELDGHRILVEERQERGLSRSRNLALSLAWDDICIFCDNDIRYEAGAFNAIEAAFERHPEAAVICFFIERDERKTPVKKSEGIMSKKDMMRIFSPEIAVRRSRLAGLEFDTSFGAGAKYPMGEENIFLFEAKRRGMKVVYVPEKIGSTLPNESSWFKGYDRDFFISRGAGYEAMDSAMWYPLALQFIIRKRKLYRDGIAMIPAYKAMKEGRREYKDTCHR